MRRFVRLTVFGLLLSSLSSCDVDLFGRDTKRIAAGWTLVQTESGFALMPRGWYVEQIGWQKPLIISRGERSRAWDVIDTSSGKQFTIADGQRRSDPVYRDIPILDAGEAWAQLNRWPHQW